MTPLKTLIYPIIACYLFSSCAASYKPINPSRFQYPESSEGEMFSYKFDVLMQSNNRKFAKKEFKNQTYVVAVRINNSTDHSLKYGENYRIFSGDREVDILPTDIVTHNIRETVPTYLLYLLFTPMTLNTYNETTSHSFPIGLIIGPGLAGLNVAVAATANKHFRMELDEYDLRYKEIASGETAYGLIGITMRDSGPLRIKLN